MYQTCHSKINQHNIINPMHINNLEKEIFLLKASIKAPISTPHSKHLCNESTNTVGNDILQRIHWCCMATEDYESTLNERMEYTVSVLNLQAKFIDKYK